LRSGRCSQVSVPFLTLSGDIISQTEEAPFAHLFEPEELETAVASGARLKKPTQCPPEMCIFIQFFVQCDSGYFFSGLI
jgi:hypothetical protein